jgi:hypothetical protein
MEVKPHDSPVRERYTGIELSGLGSSFELSLDWGSKSSTINITEYWPADASPLNDSIHFSWQK